MLERKATKQWVTCFREQKHQASMGVCHCKNQCSLAQADYHHVYGRPYGGIDQQQPQWQYAWTEHWDQSVSLSSKNLCANQVETNLKWFSSELCASKFLDVGCSSFIWMSYCIRPVFMAIINTSHAEQVMGERKSRSKVWPHLMQKKNQKVCTLLFILKWNSFKGGNTSTLKTN